MNKTQWKKYVKAKEANPCPGCGEPMPGAVCGWCILHKLRSDEHDVYQVRPEFRPYEFHYEGSFYGYGIE